MRGAINYLSEHWRPGAFGRKQKAALQKFKGWTAPTPGIGVVWRAHTNPTEAISTALTKGCLGVRTIVTLSATLPSITDPEN